MAILEKIRKRSFFLILIIGLALFAFIISGIFESNAFNGSGPINEPVGIVNNEEIKNTLFQYQLNRVESTYNVSNMEAVNMVWEQLIGNTLFKQQYEKLGIDAGKEQIESLVRSDPNLVRDPRFLNSSGIFDFNVFTDFIIQMKEESPEAYESWKQQEQGLINQAKEIIYSSLIKSSVVITEKEALKEYHLQNDKINFNYIQFPFSSIPDSLVKITDTEIENYIKLNAEEYKREPSRSIEFVHFSEQATNEDKKVIRDELNALLDTRIEYNDVSKLTDTVEGFNTTKYLSDFVNEHSEEGFDSIYIPKSTLSEEYAEILFALPKGKVFGPYEDNGFYKISKMIGKKNKGYIKARQILIAYADSTFSNGITRTKSEARKKALQILSEVRKTPSLFGALAEVNSDDAYSKFDGGSLGFFQEGEVEKELFNYANKNSVGKIGMMESDKGFHLIKIEDKRDLVLIANISRRILPSEQTSDNIFKNATEFEINALNKGAEADFSALAEEKNYTVETVSRINLLDENLPNLPAQRDIVKWSFDKERTLGDIQRFNLTNGGYAIVKLTNINEETLASVEEVKDDVTDILLKEKKTAYIINQNKNVSSLDSLASKNNLEINTALAITKKNAVLVGAGKEPYIIGAAFALEENKISPFLKGNKGVYVLQVTSKDNTKETDDLEYLTSLLKQNEYSKINEVIFPVLKANATITDNRHLFY